MDEALGANLTHAIVNTFCDIFWGAIDSSWLQSSATFDIEQYFLCVLRVALEVPVQENERVPLRGPIKVSTIEVRAACLDSRLDRSEGFFVVFRSPWGGQTLSMGQYYDAKGNMGAYS